MAVQEALILLLRASSLLSGFAQVSLTHSLSLPRSRSVACQSCLLLPPLSTPLIDSSFRLLFVLICTSLCLFLLFLVLSVLPFHLFSLSSSSLPSQGKVGHSFYYTQNGFCVSLLVWPVVFFSSFFPPLVFFLVLPCFSPFSLAVVCVASSRLWQAEWRKMKAQSSKMHQHEY